VIVANHVQSPARFLAASRQNSAWLSAAWLATLCLFGASGIQAADAPVADAAEQQNMAELEKLLENRADANAPQADGMTALHWAAWHDDAVMARRLVKSSADAKAANHYGITPLALACQNGSGEMVELLLAAGADPHAALRGGETPLMIAARTGRLAPVAALLSQGAKVDVRERKGQTALMWAAAEGHTAVVDALLKAGANLQAKLPSGFTALMFAIRQGHTETALRLLAAGADVNEALRPERVSGPLRGKVTSPLILAVENGHFDLAAQLLQAGADPNDRPAGYAALHAISWVRKPIRGDGDPPPRGSGELNSLGFVRVLAKQGAELNIRLEKGESGRGRFTTTGSTPFLLAARTADVPLMRLLVELGANPKLPNADDSPPLLAAAGVGALSDGDEAAGTEDETLAAVELLLELGADVNAQDKNGETAMHGAAYQSWAKLVPLLAKRGAKIDVWNQKNKFGWTPLAIAHGHRPGNFRPAPETIAAIEQAMRGAGVEPPPPMPREVRKGF
jgi:ankyrin repeat protein